VNRKDLQKLAVIRLKEARALLLARYYSGAYYLAGYVVECGLKACIARKSRRHDFPDRKTVMDSYTNDLAKLVKVAELETALDTEAAADPPLSDNWMIVKAWTEESRYQVIDRREARIMYYAVAGRKHGVLRWIRRHW
jgi:hypothetical protein